MTVLSRENSSRLFWLGRYSERVYTGLRDFMAKFDAMTAGSSAQCFDEGNTSSAAFSLMRAYDNAIVLRDEIGTDTFSYIQLAVYEMKNARRSPAPLLQLQKVIDNIAAFWGMADDRIDDEHVRGIIKLGKRVERVDLYARLGWGDEEIRREINRLYYRVRKAGLPYSTESLSALKAQADAGTIDRAAVIREAAALVQ